MAATARVLRYTVILDPDLEEGGFTVTVPALPGCVTEGDTRQQALEAAREAIEAYLLSLIDDGQPLPPQDVQTATAQVRVPG